MAPRPELLDNLDHLGQDRSHATALRYLIADIAPEHPLAVATGYVNLAGLHLLVEIVADCRKVRVLLGATPDPALGGDLPANRFELTLKSLEAERNLSRFPPSRATDRLSDVDLWLQDPAVEVRRYTHQFLHGKAYLFGTAHDGRAALVTSANLTRAGLFPGGNLELGTVRYDRSPAEDSIRWFDDRWSEAVDFKEELRDLLFPVVDLLEPRDVYLRTLLELYDPAADAAAAAEMGQRGGLPLAPFQQDGLDRARAILAEHHGVVYADGVGTGKTEIGLSLIADYALGRGQHALVVAPAQLAERWRERIDQHLLPAQVVSFTQLATDEQLAPAGTAHRHRHLHDAKDSYRLVVVDEGHAFRNPGTTWYQAMKRLLGGEQKDLVLLTATPINNGLWDLYHMVMLFARHDRAFGPQGIRSVRDLFLRAGANERDPEHLNPDVVFPVADAVSVRRDRRFIESHYPGATFPDGTPVRFPEPHLTTARYDLDDANPGLFADITGWISQLKMARYRPTSYEVGADENDAERALGGLLQSQVLKRFESCWWACLCTVERMVAAHDLFLQAWGSGRVPAKEALRLAASQDFDDAGIESWVAEGLEDDPGTRRSADFRSEFGEDVERDRELLQRILGRLSMLDASHDPKLALLREVLEGTEAAKVAVFASYADTVRYLDEHLPDRVGGRERIVVIGGESDPDSRTAALARFCPATIVRPDYVPPDCEVDLLISTDVLSEGQNLQQAAAVISYDMPWNPQRVVQRNGRVIRLKSPHDDVFLTTMLPETGELDGFLHLEATIRRKVLAAEFYGMESEVISSAETGANAEADDEVDAELRAFASRLTAGDATLLDETGDEAGSQAFSGEELRALVQRAAVEGEAQRLLSWPWGVGACFRQGPAVPSAGAAGAFFACRTTAGERYWRFVDRANDSVHTDDADLLRRINPGAALGVDTQDADADLEHAWSIAVSDIVLEHNRRADPRAEQEKIGPAQRFALELLRDPTVALPPGAAVADEALSVERDSTIRHALLMIRDELSKQAISRDEAAARIVAVVNEFGLQPVDPPPQLEEITEDDVGVVCWMAVLPTD